ncbi:HNH endonuclease [Glutamicibacter sp. AOP5-A2-18]|uniref:HNH endonuclease n=1 Tax=Glutamicibacter sp. AOP5-A2-18 TaxID=3457656 RepID=UPI004034560B
MEKLTCSIDGCAKPKRTRGWCNSHYEKWRRHGDPQAGREYSLGKDGFFARVDKSQSCWIWKGPVKPNGYATVSMHGKNWYVHRLSYALEYGSIPDGLELDHICHNRKCVNPDHLQAVTHKQNKENSNGAYRSNVSGVRGVTWDNRCGKWRAQISHNGVTRALGSFSRIEDAERVAIDARNKLFTNNLLDRVA